MSTDLLDCRDGILPPTHVGNKCPIYNVNIQSTFIVCLHLLLKQLRLIMSRENEKTLSRGEICVANFISPANGASLGSYLSKNCCFGAKTGIIQSILFCQS